MFNMNNSEASNQLLCILFDAVDAEHFNNDPSYFKGVAIGLMNYSPAFNGASYSAQCRVYNLFENAIAHAKAKKEQKQ